MRVHAHRAARLPQLRARRRWSWPTGLTVVAGPTAPARRTCSRRSTSAAPRARRAPRTSASWCAAAARAWRGWCSTSAATTASTASRSGFQPGEAKHLRVDGSPVDSLSAVEARPLVSVFLPERLELVKGAPAPRRAHLDQVVAALWPAPRRDARARTRARWRSATPCVARDPRRARPGPAALDAWDAELARHGIRLMEDRAEAVDGLRPPFAELAARLGLPGRGRAPLPAALAARRRRRARGRAGRAPRGRPGARLHGPRPAPRRAPAAARRRCRCAPTARRASSGPRCSRCCSPSATLLAERRARPPLMLLDDVMSELDAERRELLAELLRAGGQAVITRPSPSTCPAPRWPAAAWSAWRTGRSRLGAGGGGVRRAARPRPLGRRARGRRRPARPPATAARARRRRVWREVAGAGARGRRGARARERDGVLTVALRHRRRSGPQELELLGARPAAAPSRTRRRLGGASRASAQELPARLVVGFGAALTPR